MHRILTVHILNITLTIERQPMKVIDIIKGDKPSLSFEVFPPKTTAAWESVRTATEAIGALRPSYMSVTYGAAGTNAGFAVEIASHLQKTYDVTALAHLTCVGADEAVIDARLAQMKEAGIDIPLVAIGGITKEDIPSLLETGVTGIALSGSILRADHPIEEMRETITICHSDRSEKSRKQYKILHY